MDKHELGKALAKAVLNFDEVVEKMDASELPHTGELYYEVEIVTGANRYTRRLFISRDLQPPRPTIRITAK